MNIRLLKSVGLLSICLGGLGVAGNAYAYTGIASMEIGTPSTSDSVSVGNGSGTFLSAIFGDLSNGEIDAYTTGSGTGPYTAHLDLLPATGHSIAAYAWAIYPANTYDSENDQDCNNDQDYTYQDSAVLPHPSSGYYACFITSVQDVDGDQFTHFADYAEIEYPASGPVVRCFGRSHARAACTPYTTYESYGQIGSATAGEGPYDLGVTGTSSVCLLHMVGGDFTTSGTGFGGSGTGAGASSMAATNGRSRPPPVPKRTLRATSRR